eukprot:4913043-Prymnesium_polylepis.1
MKAISAQRGPVRGGCGMKARCCEESTGAGHVPLRSESPACASHTPPFHLFHPKMDWPSRCCWRCSLSSESGVTSGSSNRGDGRDPARLCSVRCALLVCCCVPKPLVAPGPWSRQSAFASPARSPHASKASGTAAAAA